MQLGTEELGPLIELRQRMGRNKVISQSEYPYNISARCVNREWFELPMSHVWQIFCQELNRVTEDHEWKIHSFVLMSNHYHLIASTPHANISQCMHQFMGRVSRKLNLEGNRINETFAGRHFKCILQHPNYYLNAYKYNYRNPVTAGICERVEDYRFSTLRDLLDPKNSRIILEEDSTFLSDRTGTLKWLNQRPHPEILEATRNAMKHQYFKSRKSRGGDRPLISELDLI